MRATINGTTVTVDLVRGVDDVLKVVRLALKAGLPSIEIDRNSDGFMVAMRPHDNAFAAEPLASMLAVVAEVYGKTPEALIEEWRGKAGDITQPDQ
jgi:hypothetical protein